MLPDAPSTELPTQYDHQAAQDKWYKVWEENGYFHAEPDPTGTKFPKGPFSIVIPPPNVTGALHLGHALNNTLQDILIRSKRMQGYNALWMPGTDHAGIATQAVVERRIMQEEKKSRHDLGPAELVRRIWEWKHDYEARILGQLRQMGCSCDWERTRFTLDETCAKAVRHTFFKMFSEGYIYRGKRLVNWDTFLQTAVSDDEVFHEVVQGHFWHFKYPVVPIANGDQNEPKFVTIATTRPETMLGDTAVAVHPDPAKALDKAEAELKQKLSEAPQKERDGIQKQIDDLQERRKTMLPLLIQLRDMAKAGRKLMLPLLNREIPLVADEWAKPELGSGCVKITPAHDPNDYEVGKRQSLAMTNIMNADGTLNENGGPYRGLKMPDARIKVVADLEALGLVENIEDREIDLAHSDRSKTPIEPYLADQWFVKMGDHDDGRPGLAQLAMDAVSDGRVKINPSRYAKSYLDWLKEKRDWCIGRQLWWGHRVPVWTLVNDGQFPVGKLLGSRIKTFTSWLLDGRISAYFGPHSLFENGELRILIDVDGDPSDKIHICVRDNQDTEVIELLESVGFEQSEDVLDTWFSSALWPHSTLGWPEETAELKYFYPTSVLCTSRDIITLWVARMVLTGLFNLNEIPFKDVFIHPKILDGYGEGMSKSKGNGVDPIDVMEKFGADAMRFALAHLTTETQDVRIPVEYECPHCHKPMEQTKKNRILARVPCKNCGQEFSTQWATKPEDIALPRGAVVSERFELARNFCNKLWNASRFALMNLEGYTAAPVTTAELAVEDKWLLSRLATVTQQVTAAWDSFQFAEACRVLYEFAWDEFCSFYVEMVKTRLQDEKGRVVAQRVLAHALDTLLRLLHPITPFITEEVWQLLAKVAPQRGLANPQTPHASVMKATWPIADESHIDPQIEARFVKFQQVLAGLREIRSRQNIPNKTPISFAVKCDAATTTLLQPMTPFFSSMAGAKATGWGADVASPPLAAHFSLPGIEVFVDLAGLIDVAAEITKQEKELYKLKGFIVAKEKKLALPTFAEKAPADVVQKERDGLKELQDKQSAIEGALTQLRSMQK